MGLILLMLLLCILILVYIVTQLWLICNKMKSYNNELTSSFKKDLNNVAAKNKTYYNEFIQQMRTMDSIEKQNINITSDKFEDNDDMFSPSSKKHNEIIVLSDTSEKKSSKYSSESGSKNSEQIDFSQNQTEELKEVKQLQELQQEMNNNVLEEPIMNEEKTVDTTDTKNRVILKSISRYTKAELEEMAKINNVELPENATKPVIFERLKNFFV